MTTYKHSLTTVSLSPAANIYEPPEPAIRRVGMDDPATSVMTDLKQVKAITVGSDVPIDVALNVMIYSKVRLLVVVDKTGCLVGVVTALDLMGEKPLRKANAENIPYHDLKVDHVVTPANRINALHRHGVEYSTVRDIVIHLIDADRQHALVIESTGDPERFILCGIFSTTQISRQLGIDIDIDNGRAHSFAELEKMIA
jgi:CBS domain-containing protein